MVQDENAKESVIDKWFTENEGKMLRAAREKMKKEQEEKEKAEKEEDLKEIKDLHWMKCPKCGHDMDVINIEKIELDQCCHCDGIYFDAGELDKLLLVQGDKRKSFFRKLVGL